MRRFKTWFVKNVIRPKWVAFGTKDVPNEIELGLSIFGIVIGLYKAETTIYADVAWTRSPMKREFGESLHPQKV